MQKIKLNNYLSFIWISTAKAIAQHLKSRLLQNTQTFSTYYKVQLLK